MPRRHLHTAALLLCSALLLFSVILLPLRQIEPDENAYFWAMHIFARGEVVAQLEDIAQIRAAHPDEPVISLQGWIPFDRGLILEKAPGHGFLLALAHRAGLERLVNPLWVLVCAAVMLTVFRGSAPGRRLSRLAVVLLVSNPALLIFTYRAHMGAVSNAATVCLFGLLLVAAEQQRRAWLYPLAGLALGLSVTMHYANAALYGTLLLYFVLRELIARRDARGLYAWLLRPGPWLVVAGGIAPLALQLWYNERVMGSPGGVGYQHTHLGGGMLSSVHWEPLLHNLHSVLPMQLLSFPAIVFFPAGIAALWRRHRPAALLSFLLCLTIFGIFTFHAWRRLDHFTFNARFFLPAILGVSLAGGAALAQIASRRALAGTLTILVVGSLLLSWDFFQKYVTGFRPIQHNFFSGDVLPPLSGGTHRGPLLYRAAERAGLDVTWPKMILRQSGEVEARGEMLKGRVLNNAAVQYLEWLLFKNGQVPPDGTWSERPDGPPAPPAEQPRGPPPGRGPGGAR